MPWWSWPPDGAPICWKHLDRLPDPRERRGRRHGLTAVVAVAVCTVLAGARSFAAIGEWAADVPHAVLAALRVWRDPLTGQHRPSTVATLGSDGLINKGSGLAGVSAALTHQGIEHVNALRQRRADPAQRRAAAINGLLPWLYEVDPDGERWTDVNDFLSSPWSWFAGVQLTRIQVDRAAEYLKASG